MLSCEWANFASMLDMEFKKKIGEKSVQNFSIINYLDQEFVHQKVQPTPINTWYVKGTCCIWSQEKGGKWKKNTLVFFVIRITMHTLQGTCNLYISTLLVLLSTTCEKISCD